MKIYLAIITFLLSLLAPTALSASSRAFECLSSNKPALSISEAQELAKAVQAKYGAASSFKGEFTQESYLAALDTFEASSGQVLYVKPAVMRWDYLTPEKQSFFLRDKEYQFYQPHDRQVIVDSLSNLLISELPVAFFLGVGDLTKDFEILSACRSPDGVVLKLEEKKKDKSEISSLELLVDTGLSLPKGVRVRDGSGNENSIVISGIKVNTKISSDELELVLPPGTDRIDRRAAL